MFGCTKNSNEGIRRCARESGPTKEALKAKASTTKAKDPGTLRGPLDPEAGMEVRPAGVQAHPREPTSSARRDRRAHV